MLPVSPPGAAPIEPAFVVGTTQLLAVCLRHAVGVSGPRLSASDVQAELLSRTYAVDLMPLERVSRALKPRGGQAPDPQDILVMLVGFVFQAVRGFVINVVMTLIIVTWVLALLLGVVGWIVHLL